MHSDSKITIVQMANQLGLSTTAIEKNIVTLKEKGFGLLIYK